jgi:hypothetical protein
MIKDCASSLFLFFEVIGMPYKSDAQRKWAHTPAGTKALGGKNKVKEWDKASKGRKTPERASKKGKK